MARIPLGSFGNVLPQAQQGRVIGTGAEQVAQAVSNVGQVINQNYQKQNQEKQKEQDKQDQYDFSITATEHAAEFSDIAVEIEQQLKTGELDEAGAKEALYTKNKELYASYQSKVPVSRTQQFDLYIAKNLSQTEQRIKPLAIQSTQNQANAKFEVAVEGSLKIADKQQASAMFESTLESNPYLSEGQKTEIRYKWNNRRDLSDYKNDFEVVKTDNTQLESMLGSLDKKYTTLTVEQIDYSKNQINDQIARNNKAVEEQQKDLLNTAKEVANNFVKDAYTGFVLDPDLISSTRTAVKGTEYEAQVESALTLNQYAREVRKLPISVQLSELNKLKTTIQNSTNVDASDAEQKIQALEQTIAASKTLIKEDPVSFYTSQTGRDLYKVDTTQLVSADKIDFKQANQTINALQRQKEANGYGSLNIFSPIQKQEIVDKYHQSTTDQKLTIITNLNKIAGTNNSARKELFSMLGGEQRANAYTAVSYLAERKVRLMRSNQQASNLVLEGYAIRDNKEDDELVPADNEMNKAFNAKINRAIGVGTTEYNVYKDLTLAAYTALAKYKGVVKTNDNGQTLLDQKLLDEAFELTTGGTYQQQLGGHVNTIFRPYGVSKESIDKQLEEQIKNSPMTVGMPARRLLKEYAITPDKKNPNKFYFMGANGKLFGNDQDVPFSVIIRNE